MFKKKFERLIKDLIDKSKKSKKKACFIISNTSRNDKKNYLTPIRTSRNCIYAGAVIFDDNTTEKICRFIDGNVKYIFLDTEKKAATSNYKKNPINIERTAREILKNSKIFYFKANDLAVEAASNFLEFLFSKDIRNISNKKVLILGSGNVGFKLGLKFIERGVKVFLYRRNYLKLSKSVECINIIKPKATLNKVKIQKKLSRNLKEFDIIINTSNGKEKILRDEKIILKKNLIFLEIGRNLFSNKVLRKILKRNDINIFRLDVSVAFNELIEQKINTSDQWNKKKFLRVKKKNIVLVSQGMLGEKNDIIVDNPNRPKVFFGISDGKGNLLSMSKKKKNFLKREIGII